MSEFISPFHEPLDLPWVHGQWGIASLPQLNALSVEISRQALHLGYLSAFSFFWLTAALAIPLVFLVSKPGTRRP